MRTVEALIRDVDHYLDGEPLEARPDSAALPRSASSCAATARAVARGERRVRRSWSGSWSFYTVRLARRAQRRARRGGARAAHPALHARPVPGRRRGGRPGRQPARRHAASIAACSEARALDAEPAVQAELYVTLGGIYQKLGNLTRADSLLRARARPTTRAARPDASGRRRERSSRSASCASTRRSSTTPSARFAQGVGSGQVGAPAERSGRDPLATPRSAACSRSAASYDKAIPVLAGRRAPATPRRARHARISPRVSARSPTSHFYAGHYDVVRFAEPARARDVPAGCTAIGIPQVADDPHQPRRVTAGARELQGRRAIRPRGAGHRRARSTATAIPTTALDLTMLGPRARCFRTASTRRTTLLRQALAIRERVYGPVHPVGGVDAERAGEHRYQRRQLTTRNRLPHENSGHLSQDLRRQSLSDRACDLEPGHGDLRKERLSARRGAVPRGDTAIHRGPGTQPLEYRHRAREARARAPTRAAIRGSAGGEPGGLRHTREAGESRVRLLAECSDGSGGGVRHARKTRKGGQVSRGAGRCGEGGGQVGVARRMACIATRLPEPCCEHELEHEL